jgi:hypothetical protein
LNHFHASYNTYSVKIQTIKADWILSDTESDKELGIGFLKELIKERHIDLFETDYIKILIHYLYRQFTGKIKNRLLPLYAIHYISILIYIVIVEDLRASAYSFQFLNKNIDENGQVESVDKMSDNFDELLAQMNWYQRLKDIFCFFIGVINTINIYFFINQTIHLGYKTSITRLWSIVDFVNIVLSTLICTALFDNHYTS